MQNLFSSSEGLQRLERLAGQRLLCAFDFDGTLAPIVSKPEDAQLPSSLRRQLLALQLHAPLAIITGRALADITPRLGFAPDFLIGNHGLEGLPGERAAATAAYQRSVCAGWRVQLDALLAADYPDPGVQVEDKRYSLSVHYRHAQAAERAHHDLEPLLASLEPAPRLVGGKCVFNLMPPDAGDKGSALLQLVEEIGAEGALYAGDDVTDEDVFRLTRDDLLAVRVEVSETSAAPFFVPRFEDVPQLLQLLCERLAAHRARNWRMPDVAARLTASRV